MNARTCLLCGKPLGRIWVGAGDDFCSREHGNQYRLKRGMDRLTEANKISSLMRRRESPRPIASASLPLDSGTSHRDFPDVKIAAATATRLPSLRPVAVSMTAGMSPDSDCYLHPRLPRQAGLSEPRPADSSPARFSARKTAPMVPERRIALPVRIPRARAGLVIRRILEGGSVCREFGARRHAGIRPHVGFGGKALFRMELPGTACFLSIQLARAVKVPPRIGKVQGLSRGFGSRRPARRGVLRARPLGAGVAVASLAAPAPQILYARKTFNRLAMSRAIGRRISIHKLVYPSFVARVNATGIKWSSVARMERRKPFNGHMPAIRQWGPLWSVSKPVNFSNPRRSLPVPQGTMPTPRLVTLPLKPFRANGAPHVALAPFAPQNSPFGYKEYQDK
jgi:hypothetical protein